MTELSSITIFFLLLLSAVLLKPDTSKHVFRRDIYNSSSRFIYSAAFFVLTLFSLYFFVSSDMMIPGTLIIDIDTNTFGMLHLALMFHNKCMFLTASVKAKRLR